MVTVCPTTRMHRRPGSAPHHASSEAQRPHISTRNWCVRVVLCCKCNAGGSTTACTQCLLPPTMPPSARYRSFLCRRSIIFRTELLSPTLLMTSSIFFWAFCSSRAWHKHTPAAPVTRLGHAWKLCFTACLYDRQSAWPLPCSLPQSGFTAVTLKSTLDSLCDCWGHISCPLPHHPLLPSSLLA